ncbi:endo-1,4-beta-xylanase [Desertivirga brevis]|uniref:endo-1,4-beta-xylanase n=1 Tax=Desertivirga brevis TaxID=2810310 RepID=UPI001A95FF97|nr:endo-1,4-beta-xylanase [Pedobacter sp. SYSU D00873]
MKLNTLLYSAIIAAAGIFSSCEKDSQNGAFENTGNFTDTTGGLKSAAAFPIGLAIEYQPAITNPKYWSIVKNEAAAITFGNELKNNAIVKADGSYDFATADNFYNLAKNNGIEVFGHTLVWHSQQRATYYNSLIGSSGNSGGVTNLVVNPGFETTTVGTAAEPADGWQVLNGSGQFVSASTNTNSGSKALQVNVPAGGQNWNSQLVTKAQIPVTAGKTYTISYFIKGANAQTIQFEVRPFSGTTAGSINYQGGRPVTTSYAKVSYDYVVPAGVTAIQLAFDLGGTANTLYLDDVSVIDASAVPPPSNTQIATIVDNAMKNHIQTVLSRYAGKIKAWDVINEPFADDATLRNNTNTPAGTRNDIFVWQHYLGRDFAAKAFQYAKAADPTADLYMNDYNLESSPSKLDAFVTLAKELKAANTGITGVGTQMHMLLSTPYANIINMMQKLAATGLKVRISELDIRINPGGANPSTNYVPSEYDLRLQAAMYKFVVATYKKYVPEAQRGGITVWGIDDTSSWLNTSTNVAANRLDYPLLWNKDFAKKPAYAGFKQALLGNGEN